MTTIDENAPATWQELEQRVGRILKECGYAVDVQKHAPLARGAANIDVWAEDSGSPTNVIAVECKHWKRPVTQEVVHAFRTVVSDSGANTGLIVSSSGFQPGATAAAEFSNIRLVTWEEFQALFVERWFTEYMWPRLDDAAGPLHEYTEPFNSRVLEEMEDFTREERERFRTLQEKHLPVAMAAMRLSPEVRPFFAGSKARPVPKLPIRDQIYGAAVPAEVLDATALRALMDALLEQIHAASTEFRILFDFGL